MMNELVLASRDFRTAQVVSVLLRMGPLSRSELSDATAISAPSVSRITQELLQNGTLLEDAASHREGVGRPSRVLRLSPDLGCVVGVDFGIYMTRMVFRDVCGPMLAKRTLKTPRNCSASELAAWLAAAIESALAETSGAPLRQAVVAIPGRVVSPTRVSDVGDELSNISGSEFLDHLRTDLPCHVEVEGDAAAALVNELRNGVARDAQDVVMISLSQVLAAAVALGGRLRRGAHDAAGFIRRIDATDDGRSPPDVLSFSGLKRALDKLGLPASSWDQLITGSSSTDVDALRDRFATGIARVTAALCAAIDPELVVFEGRAAPLIERVLPEVERKLDRILAVVPPMRVINDADLFSASLGCAELALDGAQEDLLRRLCGVSGLL